MGQREPPRPCEGLEKGWDEGVIDDLQWFLPPDIYIFVWLPPLECELDLITSNQQKMAEVLDVPSEVRLQEDSGLCLACLLLLSRLLTLMKESCHVVRYPIKRLMRQRTEGSPWPTVNKELRLSVHRPSKNWILPTILWVNLEVDPSPLKEVEPGDDCRPGWHLDIPCDYSLVLHNKLPPHVGT